MIGITDFVFVLPTELARHVSTPVRRRLFLRRKRSSVYGDSRPVRVGLQEGRFAADSGNVDLL
jgi:hypothetical protein